MSKKNTDDKPVKVRGYVIQRSYSYDAQSTNETEEAWKKRVEEEWFDVCHSGGVEFMLMIFHDKDVLDDGTNKPLHAHGIIKFTNARHQNAVMKTMGLSLVSNGTPVMTYVGAARYMLHITDQAMDDGKYIYNIDDIKTYGCTAREMMVAGGEKGAEKKDIEGFVNGIADKLSNGELTELQAKELIKETYPESGTKIWRRYRSGFEEDVKEYVNNKAENFKLNGGKGRKLSTIYIDGAGGTGKSTLAGEIASHFADNRGVHFVSAGQRSLTDDFAGMYKGETVTIANDMDSSSFNTQAFYGMFEPDTYTPLKSRNQDKHWFADYCFITNSTPVYKWMFDLMYYSKKSYQFPSFDIGYKGTDKGHFLENYMQTNDDNNALLYSLELQDKAWQVARRMKFWISIEKDLGQIVVRRVKRSEPVKEINDLLKLAKTEKFRKSDPDNNLIPETELLKHHCYSQVEIKDDKSIIATELKPKFFTTYFDEICRFDYNEIVGENGLTDEGKNVAQEIAKIIG